MSSDSATRSSHDPVLSSTFQETLNEGVRRMHRTWPGLLSTGLVGGIDITVGVMALLLVEHFTQSPLLAGLAFSVGFIALSLGKSELFTENFLVPVVAVVGGKCSVMELLRLWAGTAFANLLAGWLLTFVVVSALPDVREPAVRLAQSYISLGLGWESFALGILGGLVITVMTWMQLGASSEFGDIVAATGAAFLLVAGSLNHVIVVSILDFTALHAGAPFGYAQWASTAAWAALSNTLGGLVLVTVLRLIQVGAADVAESREQADADRRDAAESDANQRQEEASEDGRGSQPAARQA